MQATEKKIHGIFDRNILLYIPFFQRSYVWTEEDWRRLLDDLIETSKRNEPHFLGSVILKEEAIVGDNPIGWARQRQVIDGQQRLTTLMIILRIAAIVNQKFKKFDDYFFEDDDDVHELRLLHNIHDNDAFQYVMSLTELSELPDSLKKSNIAAAYDYFRREIDEESAALLDTRQISEFLDFVRILVDENENEQQIFDAINSLGVRLTTAELLKNYLFSKEDTGLFRETWFATFENDADTIDFWSQELLLGRLKKASIDHFLYSFLQIKINDGSVKLSAEEKDEMQRYERLFESYKLLINKAYNGDRLSVLKELIGYANKYMVAMDYEVASKPAPSRSGVERLLSIVVNMDVSTLVPYILYVLYSVEDADEQKEIFGILEGYIMRRLVTKDSNKNYNRFFTESLIGNKIKTAQFLRSYIAKSTAAYPTDAALENGFKTSLFKQHKAARGILYYMETALYDESMQSTPMHGFESYSLEHMLPQTWQGTIWDDGCDEEIRNSSLRTLGNMTIVTKKLNSTMRNSEWRVKLDLDGEKGLAHNARGLKTMTGVFTLEKWDEEQIEARAMRLTELAKQVWPYIEQ